MKRFFILLFLLGWGLEIAAQNVALGEKVPDLRVASWLDDRRPAGDRAMLVVFFHSASASSVESLAHLRQLGKTFAGRVQVVVVVREGADAMREVLRPYADAGFTVAFDDNGRSFAAYDVQYLPFGVLVSPRGRALWMGNPGRLTAKEIESNL